MDQILWTLLAIQIALGAFDTLWHHEFTERLAWKPSQQYELKLHSVRNLIYAALFMTLGWSYPSGLLAWAALALLVVELLITLKDFVEEDQTRRLPATERITHTLLALNYGAILSLLVPHLLAWSQGPSALVPSYSGLWSWMMSAAAVGVGVFGVRDLHAAQRLAHLTRTPAADLLQGLDLKGGVLILGGTGFIGTRLVEALVAMKVPVTVVTRKLKNATHLATPVRLMTSPNDIDDEEVFKAIINLAGEPLAGSLWTKGHLAKVQNSRLNATRSVVKLIERLHTKPECFINGSAIGIYGVACDQPVGETDPIAHDTSFSQELCRAWEAAAVPVQAMDVRTILLRTGLVLDRDGGPLAQMLFPFEFGIGGPFGLGRHWMSWITRDDLVRLIGHCISDARARGAVNGVGPNPVTNATFAKALGQALERPAILPLPAFVLRLGLGGLGEEVLLGSQHVIPAEATRLGFQFKDPELQPVLNGMLRTS